ncbi:hypothetical protein [Thioclava kandeliae]|uniref:VPLPA-CTERM sorting domain-containing protein n=1 Tax=Thioclava kandeliae TaxID=3070818 RepID=A0ABV1SMK4_9RHOB
MATSFISCLAAGIVLSMAVSSSVDAATYTTTNAYTDVATGTYVGSFDLSELTAAVNTGTVIESAMISVVGYSPENANDVESCESNNAAGCTFIDNTNDRVKVNKTPDISFKIADSTKHSQQFGQIDASGYFDTAILEYLLSSGSPLSYTMTVTGDFFSNIAVTLTVLYSAVSAPDYNANISPVPLPPAGLALAGALLAMAGFKRRSRKQ